MSQAEHPTLIICIDFLFQMIFSGICIFEIASDVLHAANNYFPVKNYDA